MKISGSAHAVSPLRISGVSLAFLYEFRYAEIRGVFVQAARVRRTCDVPVAYQSRILRMGFHFCAYDVSRRMCYVHAKYV